MDPPTHGPATHGPSLEPLPTASIPHSSPCPNLTAPQPTCLINTFRPFVTEDQTHSCSRSPLPIQKPDPGPGLRLSILFTPPSSHRRSADPHPQSTQLRATTRLPSPAFSQWSDRSSGCRSPQSSVCCCPSGRSERAGSLGQGTLLSPPEQLREPLLPTSPSSLLRVGPGGHLGAC